MAFAHLHVHSHFSLLNGVPTPKELIGAAKAAGMANLALTDTCNLYGAVDFYKNCKDKGVHPVFGSEIWVDPRGMACREGELRPTRATTSTPTSRSAASDRGGLERLCRYVLRPPLALERLERLPNGRVVLGFKWAWSDGTSGIELST